MTIRDMQIFIEVAKTSSMTAASKNLYISQSTVSQAILSIEHQYDVLLFDRLTKRLLITKQGTVLLEYCRQILELHRRMEYELQYASEKSIRIGATLISLTSILMNEIWGNYHRACPDIRTQICVEESQILLYKLQNSELDIAVVEDPPSRPDLVYHQFAEDSFVLICGRKSEFFGRTELELEELQGRRLIMRERGNPTRDLFEQNLTERNLRLDIESYWNIDVIKTEVSANRGESILASRLAAPEIQCGLLHTVPIRDFSLKRYFYAVHHKSLHMTPYVDKFLRVCQSISKGAEPEKPPAEGPRRSV